jgi:hypothetical protein
MSWETGVNLPTLAMTAAWAPESAKFEAFLDVWISSSLLDSSETMDVIVSALLGDLKSNPLSNFELTLEI